MPVRHTLALATALAATGLVAACSSPHTVTTRDGQTSYTSDAPAVDKDSDFVTYEKNGREVKVNKSEVQRIEELD